MQNILSLKKLQFGKTDAFNELKAFGDEWFTKAFFLFEKYEIEKFIDGSSYYICGEKGTGKTAMLRYLQCILSEDLNNLIIPIRFKTDLDREDKKSIIRAAGAAEIKNVKEEVAENLEDFRTIEDAVYVWEVYILNKIFHACQENGEYQLFEESSDLDAIKKLLNLIYPEYKNSIVPKMKRGNLKISANISKLLDAEIQLEIGLDSSASSISFTKVAKAIVYRFSKLIYKENKVYILFDELELSMQSAKEHQRDIKLIRDLIIAIDRLNEICKLNNFGIHIISSIRTEVIKSVYNAGYEINKPIEDYGIIITWYQKGGNYEDNKLLKIIENKIIASEEINGIIE
ncbi:P-loop ATPase, Sll1717 family, partial [Ruminococcus sp.]|uniref:P-loop ATPase, Sll1717 family n=1 Tax=Ruminococcus sp. TaxID=41978 RepID=UPI003F02BEFD